jgi:ubiquinone/menaquinone biosynthesis C-methylase UbiE
MAATSRHDAWQAGENYEAYMGRWSRLVAPRFLEWLDVPAGLDWLEVGCGTGALSAAILEQGQPGSLVAIDPSAGFVAQARATVNDPRATFVVGDAQAQDLPSGSRDVVVSALALNFIPDRETALAEMRRVARGGAVVGFYVWDYPGGGMEMMRRFWTAATALDPKAQELTEDRRFPFCTPEALAALAEGAGLEAVACRAVEVATVFRSFDDYWRPFTLGAGPAPGYCASLAPDARERLRLRLHDGLPRGVDGSIALRARAWAVKGRVS